MPSSGEIFGNTPSSLRASTGSITLWSIDTSGTNELFSFKDILAESGVKLTSPAAGKKVMVNPITGKSYDVSFIWERPDKGQEYRYDLEIAFDKDFKEKAVTTNETSSSSTPNHIVGPGGETTYEFMPGTTYYWRVRVDQEAGTTFLSPWSEVRSFNVKPGVAAVPDILSPSNGSTGISRTPSFSWEPVSGTTEYRFVLAKNVALDSPLIDVRVKATGFAIVLELDYGTSYYWAVKPISPVEGDWSAIANFTVKEEPVPPKPAEPPVVVKEVPPPVINIPAPPPAQEIVIPPAPQPPAPIAPAYIWAIIIIGAVLVIAVIVLIVRTRRAV
jgi:hypothetical protein